MAISAAEERAHGESASAGYSETANSFVETKYIMASFR